MKRGLILFIVIALSAPVFAARRTARPGSGAVQTCARARARPPGARPLARSRRTRLRRARRRSDGETMVLLEVARERAVESDQVPASPLAPGYTFVKKHHRT